jgi:hypothetical protein
MCSGRFDHSLQDDVLRIRFDSGSISVQRLGSIAFVTRRLESGSARRDLGHG